jgi:hypothetical protein
MKKSAIELVMEAVANSDVVTLDDMESLDIRDKYTLDRSKFKASNGCILCALDIPHDKAKEDFLDDYIEALKNFHGKPKPDVIEHIYNNPVLTMRLINEFIEMGEGSTLLLDIVMSAIKRNSKFKMTLLKIMLVS